MEYKKPLILTDNLQLFDSIHKILIKKKLIDKVSFIYACTKKKNKKGVITKKICVKSCVNELLSNYDLIISVHCTQIFPKELVENIKCINLHPGFNPYNRGWYPHIFSLLNGLPAGATIHEMDAFIDNGPIIIQEQVPIYSYDTSISLYTKILKLELKLFTESIDSILMNSYTTFKTSKKGNLNLKKDYKKLMCLDLEKKYTGNNFLNLIRALSHEPYKNAYFFDKENNKVYLKVVLEKE